MEIISVKNKPGYLINMSLLYHSDVANCIAANVKATLAV
jgi:hypothetical protein